MDGLERATQRVKEFRAREQDILNCAEQLFLGKGEDGVTVEMIAEKAGIGKGTVYKHFQSKDEIYLLLMIRYEQELADTFCSMELDQAGGSQSVQDKERLAREYFKFRMKNPQRYSLFDRLEGKLSKVDALPELMAKLYSIRSSNLEVLSGFIQTRIDAGALEKVPVSYHIAAAWALVHGAVALSQSRFYSEHIDDIDEREAFFEFLMDISVRMGNRRSEAQEVREIQEVQEVS